jgi:chromosome segregation ATPase
MKIESIRQQFKNYRAKIIELEEEINRLQNQLDEEEYNANRQIEKAHYDAHMATRRANEAEEQRRNAEYAERHRQDDISSVTRELERARSYGDSYGVERAVRKLRNI